MNGKIVTIDQKYFQNPSVNASLGASILIINHSQPVTGSVGVGMYPSLMGTFNCPMPIFMIGSSFGEDSSSLNLVYFRTTNMEDPWILPSLSTSSVPTENDVSFPATMVAYQANIDQVAEPSPSSSRTEEEDPYVLLAWTIESTSLMIFFHLMKLFLRTCLGLRNLGKSCTIDPISFLSSIV